MLFVQHIIHHEASITVQPFHNQDWTRDRPGLLTQWHTSNSHTHSISEAQVSTLLTAAQGQEPAASQRVQVSKQELDC